jgi:hypothetical protein
VAIGRGPARFSGRGFLAAHDIAFGRHDHQRMARLRSTIEEIWADDPVELAEWQGYMDGDAGQIHRYLVGQQDAPLPARQGMETAIWRPEVVERMVSRCCDLLALPEVELLEAMRRSGESANLAMVGVQARRGLALVQRDAGELAAVLATCEADGVEAISARVRCELGELRGDEALLSRGITALERLGDVDQRDRVVARHGGS